MMMNSGGKDAAGRLMMIPSSIKNTIENIKEITGQSHSEEEIYAMLKECSMDPNETAQKLLLQDTFHEVKRKRDRRKEYLNKESVESRWKPGVQTRVNRGGQRNHASQYVSRDGGRNLAGGKENATSQISEKDSSPAPLPKSQDAKSYETTSFASVVPDAHASRGSGVNQSKATGNTRLGKSEGRHQILNSGNCGTSLSSAPSSGVHLFSSDPDFVPSQDSCLASAQGTIKHEVEMQCIPVEQMADTSVEGKSFAVSATEVGNSIEQKMPSNCKGAEKDNIVESPQTTSSSIHGGSSISRPSSNSNNRPLSIGPPKVGTGKEWKPKSANSSITQRSGSVAPLEIPGVPVESHTTLQPTPNFLASKDVTLELQRKLDDSHISRNQQVIIPSHLHVPEAGKLGFCFGSFDASFGLDTSCGDASRSNESPCRSKSSKAVEEPAKEQSSSHQNGLVAAEDTERKYPYISQSSSHGPENFPSSDVEVSSSVAQEYVESKQEVAPRIHQHPLAHTSNYSFGFMPPILSSHLAPLESSESQAQQSFDLASYYAQFYRPDADSDGRTSPFNSTGAATKYNENAAVVSSQISPSPQESGVPLVLSTAAPTSVATQSSGVMQPLPVLQQPTGVHLPHYPPNYFPYGPYLSPLYVPQPAIHQFLGNGAFPQQPQTGTVYPTPPGVAAKYSISQYKQGPNTGNATHIGMPGNYGTYGLPLPNYASSSATTADNLSSEDLAPQFKENNVVSSQQGEGSSLWFTTPSRDISTLQAGSFYNLPQGQLAFSPTQPGQGAFTGLFHSVQPVTSLHPLPQQSQSITTPIDMMRPTASVHHQAQIN
ncbi:GBF-interacting protein 1-like isoform X4 [Olea europaea var. sylvestris]|uniref:GBF-interacting protein 1-like isoform X4 n=1 Tax=Olea europaea var. sylvestris TaxID=158386 RepID=UPI000C1D0540|nr:GBF-interacting protein 1-like isoform X4 [Olea europaea var. sylvestris]